MTAKQYQDLVVWQIADELRREICRLTEGGTAARDFRFRDQLRQSSGGIPTNIAEGFRRLAAREFLQFLRYAYASAGETAEWIEDGVARKHWNESEVAEARRLLGRLNPPQLGLIRYLRTPQAQAKKGTLSSYEPREPVRTNPLSPFGSRQRQRWYCRLMLQEIV